MGGGGNAAHPLLAGPGGLARSGLPAHPSVFTVALVNGGPWVAVGTVGFVVWLVFVIVASISLLRSRPVPDTA